MVESYRAMGTVITSDDHSSVQQVDVTIPLRQATSSALSNSCAALCRCAQRPSRRHPADPPERDQPCAPESMPLRAFGRSGTRARSPDRGSWRINRPDAQLLASTQQTTDRPKLNIWLQAPSVGSRMCVESGRSL